MNHGSEGAARSFSMCVGWAASLCLWVWALQPPGPPAGVSPESVLAGLKSFWEKTALPDGSFRPGVDPDYKGMSDSAYSNLAPVTYAVVIHRTFGWTLPNEDKTLTWIINRQERDGAFANTAGTVDPKSAQGRVYHP